MKADKEGTAVTELIKLHNEMVKKSSQEPAPAITNVLVKSQPKTFWQRWFG
jgi:hypothetical protein